MYNLLICDDEKDIVNALKIYLSDPSYELYTASNGEEALRIVEREDIHLVLMDIMMPVMNGIDASIAIRALHRPDAKTVKIIALSANAFTDDVRRSISAGINEHIAKPIDTQQLFSVLEKYTAGNPHLRNN